MTPADPGAGDSGPSVVGVAGGKTRGAAASISIVLATPGTLATRTTTIECLARRAIRDRIELVLVAPSNRASDLDGDPCTRLGAVVAVRAGPVVSIGGANAPGDEQDAWLEAETPRHWELRARGHRLRLLADAAERAVGCGQGPGNAAAAVGRDEYDRHRHLSARDLGDPRLARYATVSAG